MSEALLNTNFHLFEHWNNGVNHNAFVNSSPLNTSAITPQYDGTDVKKYDIKQDFIVNNEHIKFLLIEIQTFLHAKLN